MHQGRVATKGRVTIPKKIREKLNIKSGDVVNWTIEKTGLKLRVTRKAEQNSLFEN